MKNLKKTSGKHSVAKRMPRAAKKMPRAAKKMPRAAKKMPKDFSHLRSSEMSRLSPERNADQSDSAPSDSESIRGQAPVVRGLGKNSKYLQMVETDCLSSSDDERDEETHTNRLFKNPYFQSNHEELTPPPSTDQDSDSNTSPSGHPSYELTILQGSPVDIPPGVSTQVVANVAIVRDLETSAGTREEQTRGKKRPRESDATTKSQPKRNKIAYWKKRPQDQSYMWTEEMPLAELFKTETFEKDLKAGNARKYFSDPNFADKCSEKISRVHDPRDQDLVFYKGVAISDITSMKLSDGYCWKMKNNPSRKKDIWMYNCFAELEVAGVYQKKFRKFYAYQPSTFRMVLLYVGDHRYTTRHPVISMNVPEAMRPPVSYVKVHPTEAVGAHQKQQLDRYTRIWKKARKITAHSAEEDQLQEKDEFFLEMELDELADEFDPDFFLDSTPQGQLAVQKQYKKASAKPGTAVRGFGKNKAYLEAKFFANQPGKLTNSQVRTLVSKLCASDPEFAEKWAYFVSEKGNSKKKAEETVRKASESITGEGPVVRGLGKNEAYLRAKFFADKPGHMTFNQVRALVCRLEASDPEFAEKWAYFVSEKGHSYNKALDTIRQVSKSIRGQAQVQLDMIVSDIRAEFENLGDFETDQASTPQGQLVAEMDHTLTLDILHLYQ